MLFFSWYPLYPLIAQCQNGKNTKHFFLMEKKLETIFPISFMYAGHV